MQRRGNILNRDYVGREYRCCTYTIFYATGNNRIEFTKKAFRKDAVLRAGVHTKMKTILEEKSFIRKIKLYRLEFI